MRPPFVPIASQLVSPDDATYPSRLHATFAPPHLRVSGPLEHYERAVAVVGSRTPVSAAAAYAYALAFDLAKAGVLVVSGGAKGIDAAAHSGAIAGGGTTWIVCPHGLGRAPKEPGAVDVIDALRAETRARFVSLFADDAAQDKHTPLARNKLVVALVDAVVVVQAWKRSGSLNAVSACRKHTPPFEPWVVPGPPWDERFHGSALAIEDGARPLVSPLRLFHELGVAPPATMTSLASLPEEELVERHKKRSPTWPTSSVGSSSVRKRPTKIPPSKAPPQVLLFEGWSEDENNVYSCISLTPSHVDEISDRSGMNVGATVTALLTLVLKDVVVEGPDGFFRRALAR